MTRVWIATGSAVLALSVVVSGQARPDFTGTWTFDATKTSMAGVSGQGSGGQVTWPATLVIAQTAGRMEVQASTPQQLTQTLAFLLDGSETTVRGSGDITTRVTAVWSSNALVVTSRRSYPGPQGVVTFDLKEAYQLSGGNLVVDRTETQQGKSVTRKVVYTKGTFDARLAAPLRPTRTPTGSIVRLPNGRPDLQGYWTGDSSGSWSVEAHQAGFGLAGGGSMVTDPADGKVPYQPWAATERERRRHDLVNDPEPHCFPSGVPRQMFVNTFQILQLDSHVVILYEYVHARRIITMDKPHTSSRVRFWQGDSVGRWEGDTLVIDTDHFTDKTWLDMDGDFYSENARVVERLTMLDANTIQYQATIEDDDVFTRPWTIQFLMQRETDPAYQILEAACHEDNRDLEHVKAAFEKGIK